MTQEWYQIVWDDLMGERERFLVLDRGSRESHTWGDILRYIKWVISITFDERVEKSNIYVNNLEDMLESTQISKHIWSVEPNSRD
jgi:hypothetical protein